MVVKGALYALDWRAAGKVGGVPPGAPLHEHAGSSPGGQGSGGGHHCCPARGPGLSLSLRGPGLRAERGCCGQAASHKVISYGPPAVYTSLKGQSSPLYKGPRTWSPCSEQVRDQSGISPPLSPNHPWASLRSPASGPPHVTSPKGCLSVFMTQQVASLRRRDPRGPFPASGATPSLLPYPVGPLGPA